MRKTLSTNFYISLSIDLLMEDEDMNYNLKREELETLILAIV